MIREILFIAHRIPFPPDRGDKIRSHHILKRLARIAPVHVACFADDDLDQGEEVELAALARSYHLQRRTKPLLLAGIQALLSKQPVNLAAFHDAAFEAYIREVLEECAISTIYVYSGQMGQYVPQGFAGRVVVDFVDADSAKYEAYAGQRKGLMRWIHAREARLLRAEEARMAQSADVSLLITPEEAAFFASRLPDAARAKANIQVLKNGIDSEYYDPVIVEAEPRMAELPRPRLIFTGQMDYAPNVDAMIRAADRIMPLIRSELPEATLHVVGRNPTDALMARNGKNGVHVWGRVEDVRPWLKGADMALVPLDIARGVQNKVLEAMSMALPVVLTSAAATGIPAVDGQHFRIAETDEALAAEAILFHASPHKARIKGSAARRFVSDNASWQAALAELPEIVGAAGPAVRDAA